jgi:hypothetical protein
MLADELAEALWPDQGGREHHTRAPVAKVDGATAYVRLRGAAELTPCSMLAGAAPKAGDLALVLAMPSGCVVLGTIQR